MCHHMISEAEFLPNRTEQNAKIMRMKTGGYNGLAQCGCQLKLVTATETFAVTNVSFFTLKVVETTCIYLCSILRETREPKL